MVHIVSGMFLYRVDVGEPGGRSLFEMRFLFGKFSSQAQVT